MIELKRVDCLDVAKGIAIILVVFGHAISKDMASKSIVVSVIRTNIYWIHMPAFFAVAGILFGYNKKRYKENSVSAYIKKKSITYLIPYCTFSLFSFLVFSFIESVPALAFISEKTGYTTHSISQFIFSVITYINPVDDHLWFVYVMFLVCCLSRLLIDVDSRLMIFVMLVLNSLMCFLDTPEIVWKTIRYAMVFYIGVYWQDKDILNNIRTNKFLVALAGFVMSVIINTYFRYSVFLWYKCITYPIALIYGAYILLVLASILQNKKKIANVLKYMGNNSYPIYLMHQPFIVNGLAFILGRMHLYDVLVVSISGTIGTVVPLILNRFIVRKNPITKLLLLGNH